MARAEQTRQKLEAGLVMLEQMIRATPLSPKTGRYTFEGAISVKAVLRMGGIKSSATLHHAHHAETKRWLARKVDELKALAGRGKYRKRSVITAKNTRNREAKLAQELAAAHYRIMELEAKLSGSNHGKGNKVVLLSSRRKKT